MTLFPKKIKLAALALALLAFSGCEPKLDAPTPQKGEADFTRYVALGNSLTAGYNDGALHREGQLNASYAHMMSEQFAAVGGGEFKTPLMPEGPGNNGSGMAKLVLANLGGNLLPVPDPQGPSEMTNVASEGPFQNMGVPGARSFHLVAPGYGSAAGNPFFRRFATSATTSVVQDAAAQAPTFFSLWIGNNDVLGYALAGGESDEITPTGTFNAAIDGIVGGLQQAGATGGVIANIPNILKIPYFNTVTWNAFALDAAQAEQLNAGLRVQVAQNARPTVEAGVTAAVRAQVRPQVVDAVRAQVTQAVTAQVRASVAAQVREQVYQEALAGGASEADANAAADSFMDSEAGTAAVDAQMSSEAVQAQIESLVNAQMEDPATQALIDQQLDQQMQSPEVQALIAEQVEIQLEALLAGLPTFSEGPNPFILEDTGEQLGFRLATEDDLLLLDALLFVQDPNNAGVPIPDEMVLDLEEQQNITAAIAAYNDKLQSVAQSNNYAFADIAGFFDDIQTGFSYDAVSYSTTFVTGGAFSLDAIHLTPRGAALVANEFIEAINAKYNASVSTVNVNDYEGIGFP